MRTNFLTTDDEIFIRENAGKISNRDIATHLNKQYKFICSKIIEFGLLNNKRGESVFSHKHPRKYDNNDSYFETPNLENCYWAGFLAADGFIRETTENSKILGCMLAIKDKEHLNKFRNAIDSNKPLHLNTSNGFPICSLVISSVKLVNDLKQNFSFIQRKSLVLKPPKIEDKDLIDAFIIGYIDGDGSIGLYETFQLRISIVGGIDILSWINERFKEILDKEHKISLCRPTLPCLVHNGIDARILFKHYYNINVPKLERKWSLKHYNNAFNYIHPHTKIKKNDIKEIFEMNKQGISKYLIAEKYMVHRGTIDRILRINDIEDTL